MKKQLQLSELTESLERGKNNFRAQIELYDLQKFCHNLNNPQLLEYVPVKIVACFEQLFRDEYKEILDNPKVKKNLKNIDLFKDTKFNFDIIGAFEENTILLSEYLSLLIPCSKLGDIDNAISKLLGIKFLEEFGKREDSNAILESIIEVFRLRHIYCHEVPMKKVMDVDKARKLISHAISFIDNSDDIIRTVLYSDQLNIEEEFENAKLNYNKANSELESLIERIQAKQDGTSLFYVDFSYIEKWKEYREERAKCDSSYNEGIYSPLQFYQNLERITKALRKELTEDYKYVLRHSINK